MARITTTIGATLAAFALATVLGAAATAQTTTADQDHTAHHPAGEAAQAAPAAPQPAPPSAAGPQRPTPGMGPGMMMGGDMGRMMPMMQRMMASAGGMMGGPAMHGFRRVDGQLAYVRAELRITEAQAPQWTAFADAVRTAVAQLRQAYAQAPQPLAQRESVPQHLERQIVLLSARLEATRAIATAAEPLYAALTDEQKDIAGELLTEHLRAVPMRRM